MATATEDALLLARTQLALLQAGDVDGFLLADAACTQACQDAAAAQEAGPLVEAQLQELVTITTAIGTELGRMMDEAAARMDELNRRRQATGAYLSSPGIERPNRADY